MRPFTTLTSIAAPLLIVAGGISANRYQIYSDLFAELGHTRY